MKLLYVGLGLLEARGGAEKAIQNLAVSMSRISTEAIHFLTAGYKKQDSLLLPNSKLFTIGNTPTKFGYNFLKTSKKLEQAIVYLNKKYEYDMIFINTYAGYVPKIEGFRLNGYPKVVFNFHDTPSYLFFNLQNLPFSIITCLWQLTAFWLKKRAISTYKGGMTYFIATSSSIKKDLIKFGVPPDKILLQPNGFSNKVKINQKRKIKNVTIFYTVGISYQKGTHKLIQAFNQLNNYNWRLFIIGAQRYVQRPFISRVLAKIKPKFKNNILVTGYITQQQFERIQQISDYFISLSLTEACQTSVIEALKSQIPVYSTNVGIVPDLIYRKVNNVSLLNNHDLEKVIRTIDSIIKKTSKHTIQISEQNYNDILTDWSVVAKRVLEFLRKINSF